MPQAAIVHLKVSLPTQQIEKKIRVDNYLIKRKGTQQSISVIRIIMIDAILEAQWEKPNNIAVLQTQLKTKITKHIILH